MRSRVGIITGDDIFYNKIKLILRADADAVRTDEKNALSADCDVIFVDLRSSEPPKRKCVSFGEGGDIPFPFKHEDVLAALEKAKRDTPTGLYVTGDGKHAYLSGRPLTLTKVEYRLLERLLSEDVGAYVSREELLESVWGGACDPGVVVVYMHYLRKKLEAGGERVIITKRGKGESTYKIDEKYREK